MLHSESRHIGNVVARRYDEIAREDLKNEKGSKTSTRAVGSINSR